jgi:hypothetical protein
MPLLNFYVVYNENNKLQMQVESIYLGISRQNSPSESFSKTSSL